MRTSAASMPSIDVPEISPTTRRALSDDFFGTLQLQFAGSKKLIHRES
jgi:hypothetical protein